MTDALTNKIIQQLNELPIIKRKAILELIKIDSIITQRHTKAFQEKWRKELLTTSVWTDSEINVNHSNSFRYKHFNRIFSQTK